MRRAVLPLIATALWSCAVSPNDPSPVVRTEVRVDHERFGSCFDLTVTPAAHGSAVRLEGACHGWTTQSCGGAWLVRAEGVMIDQAAFAADAGPVVDLREAVSRALGERWPGQEMLHLTFGTAVCGATNVVPFTGSRILKQTDGSATAVAGYVAIGEAGQTIVAFDAR